MADAGACIFGRPEGQVSISNGLFKEKGLGSVMYLEGLTDGLILEEGESIGVIRQVTRGNLEPTGITIVGIIHYARSYSQDRPGGFIGAAVCFKGVPHPGLINNVLIPLSEKSLKLIDDNSKKFKSADPNNWNISMPEPDDRWIRDMKGLHQVGTKTARRLIISTETGIKRSLLSAVQGILANRKFNKYETVVLASNGNFLKRAYEKKYNIAPILELFDFHDHFHEINKQLDNKIAEGNKIISQGKIELNKIQIDRLKEEKQVERLKKEYDEIKLKVSDLKADLETKRENLTDLSRREDEKRKELQKLQNDIDRGVNNCISNRQVQEYIEKVKKEENNKIKSRIEEKYVRIRRRSFFGFLVKPSVLIVSYLLILLIGATISFLIFKANDQVSNFQADSPSKPSSPPGINIGNNEENISEVSYSIPASISDMIKKVKPQEQLESEKEIINQFLIENYGNSGYLGWDSISEDYYDKSYAFIPFPKEQLVKLELNEHDFGTDKRVEILKMYLEMPGNIYENIGVDAEDINEQSPILQHFRWVVFCNSSYSDDKSRDLTRTNETLHTVPIFKQ